MLIVGIAGGSGSGKTTLANQLDERIQPWLSSEIISLDQYYHDQPDLTFEQRLSINYDHPDSIDFKLLLDHLQQLSQGETVELPQYDFENYTRSSQTQSLTPPQVLILEGILLLCNQAIINFLNISLYVDTATDIRLLRRLNRDTKERGRSLASVLDQYQQTVRPMHYQFVQPSRKQADLVVSGEKSFDKLVDFLSKTMISQLEDAA